MATFSVAFLGCKVSQTDAHEIRERLVADGHVERDSGGEIAVVNSCCVTNEAVAKSRQAARRAARTARRVYVTGCAANLGSGLDGLPENVEVVGVPSERVAAHVADSVGAIGCVQAPVGLHQRSETGRSVHGFHEAWARFSPRRCGSSIRRSSVSASTSHWSSSASFFCQSSPARAPARCMSTRERRKFTRHRA